MPDIDALFARKCELQRRVLDHWNELQRVKCEHERLLSELRAVRAALQPDVLIDELFYELYPEAS